MNRVPINTDGGGGFPMHQGRVLQDGVDELHPGNPGCEGWVHGNGGNGGL